MLGSHLASLIEPNINLIRFFRFSASSFFFFFVYSISLINFLNLQIEPESQTQLLDATMGMEGVLLAGVPGAGGFDAVFAITLGDSGSNVTKAWSSLNVLALLVREDPHGVSLETGDPRTKEITSAVSAVQIE